MNPSAATGLRHTGHGPLPRQLYRLRRLERLFVGSIVRPLADDMATQGGRWPRHMATQGGRWPRRVPSPVGASRVVVSAPCSSASGCDRGPGRLPPLQTASFPCVSPLGPEFACRTEPSGVDSSSGRACSGRTRGEGYGAEASGSSASRTARRTPITFGTAPRVTAAARAADSARAPSCSTPAAPQLPACDTSAGSRAAPGHGASRPRPARQATQA